MGRDFVMGHDRPDPPDHDALYRIAFAACGDPDLSEEAVAEGVARAVVVVKRREENPAEARDHQELTMGWFRRVITNFIHDHRRHRGIVGREPESALQIVLDPADGPAARAERREMLTAVAEEFAALPEAYRRILELRIVQGVPMKDASAALDVPVGTLENHYTRAIRTLRERFDRRQLAGGVTVAGAIGRSGKVVKTSAPHLAAAAVSARAVVAFLAFVLGASGVTWALLRWDAGSAGAADLDPLLARAAPEGDAGADVLAPPNPGDDAARKPDAPPPADADAAADAGPAPPPAAAEVDEPTGYRWVIQVLLDGEPVEGWSGTKPLFEPYAQSPQTEAQSMVDQRPDSAPDGTITYTMPMEPRGKWGVWLDERLEGDLPAMAYVHVVIDPLAALPEGPGGERRLVIELKSASKTFEDGIRRFGLEGPEDVHLVQQIRPGIWAAASALFEGTGDDLVFPDLFAGQHRLCRADAGWMELSDLPGVDPPWEGWID